MTYTRECLSQKTRSYWSTYGTAHGLGVWFRWLTCLQIGSSPTILRSTLTQTNSTQNDFTVNRNSWTRKHSSMDSVAGQTYLSFSGLFATHLPSHSQSLPRTRTFQRQYVPSHVYVPLRFQYHEGHRLQGECDRAAARVRLWNCEVKSGHSLLGCFSW